MNRSDTAAIIICRMDNDAVMKSLQPNFRRESVRKKYANDDWSPDSECKKKGRF